MMQKALHKVRFSLPVSIIFASAFISSTLVVQGADNNFRASSPTPSVVLRRDYGATTKGPAKFGFAGLQAKQEAARAKAKTAGRTSFPPVEDQNTTSKGADKSQQPRPVPRIPLPGGRDPEPDSKNAWLNELLELEERGPEPQARPPVQDPSEMMTVGEQDAASADEEKLDADDSPTEIPVPVADEKKFASPTEEPIPPPPHFVGRASSNGRAGAALPRVEDTGVPEAQMNTILENPRPISVRQGAAGTTSKRTTRARSASSSSNSSSSSSSSSSNASSKKTRIANQQSRKTVIKLWHDGTARHQGGLRASKKGDREDAVAAPLTSKNPPPQYVPPTQVATPLSQKGGREKNKKKIMVQETTKKRSSAASMQPPAPKVQRRESPSPCPSVATSAPADVEVGEFGVETVTGHFRPPTSVVVPQTRRQAAASSARTSTAKRRPRTSSQDDTPAAVVSRWYNVELHPEEINKEVLAVPRENKPPRQKTLAPVTVCDEERRPTQQPASRLHAPPAPVSIASSNISSETAATSGRAAPERWTTADPSAPQEQPAFPAEDDAQSVVAVNDPYQGVSAMYGSYEQDDEQEAAPADKSDVGDEAHTGAAPAAVEDPYSIFPAGSTTSSTARAPSRSPSVASTKRAVATSDPYLEGNVTSSAAQVASAVAAPTEPATASSSSAGRVQKKRKARPAARSKRGLSLLRKTGVSPKAWRKVAKQGMLHAEQPKIKPKTTTPVVLKPREGELIVPFQSAAELHKQGKQGEELCGQTALRFLESGNPAVPNTIDELAEIFVQIMKNKNH
ncbi:unnamed protein product, partial [Amoebophrya sp. A120]|eukprot:GSA120T00015758001.1